MAIKSVGTLKGTVKSAGTLKGTVKSVGGITGRVYVSDEYQKEAYKGPYEVEPSSEEQILLTKEKNMVEDFIIRPIPYAEVTNTSQGITVMIG